MQVLSRLRVLSSSAWHYNENLPCHSVLCVLPLNCSTWTLSSTASLSSVIRYYLWNSKPDKKPIVNQHFGSRPIEACVGQTHKHCYTRQRNTYVCVGTCLRNIKIILTWIMIPMFFMVRNTWHIYNSLLTIPQIFIKFSNWKFLKRDKRFQRTVYFKDSKSLGTESRRRLSIAQSILL